MDLKMAAADQYVLQENKSGVILLNTLKIS